MALTISRSIIISSFDLISLPHSGLSDSAAALQASGRMPSRTSANPSAGSGTIFMRSSSSYDRPPACMPYRGSSGQIDLE